MSKIDEILQYINEYLAGNDHSDQPLMSKYAKFYAEACCEVNRKLAECRSLLDKGLQIDAQRLNSEMRPSLAERALTLHMSKRKFEQYIEICRMYHYPQPQAIDTETVRELCSGENCAGMNAMILSWRKIARSHDHIAKIKLLRKILTVCTTGSEMWRSNLLNVEQKYMSELLSAANSSLAAGDDAQTARLASIIKSEPWLLPPDDNLLQAYQPSVKRIKKAALDQALENKRNELFQAYSIMDQEMIKGLLDEYDILTANELYQPDFQAEQAVREIREFWQDQENTRRKKADFQQKLGELIQELDRHGDYEIIENLYETLRQMDMPLEENISRRVQIRREDFIDEKIRRHKRRCLYGITASVLLLILCGVIFTAIKNYRTYKYYCTEMEDLIGQANYDGAIALYEEVRVKHPILLQFKHLIGLKLRSEQLKEEMLIREQKLQDICLESEKLLTAAEPDISALQRLNHEMQALKNGPVSPELTNRCRYLDNQLLKLEMARKTQRENTFTQQMSEQLKKLSEYSRSMEENDVDFDQLRQDIEYALGTCNSLLEENKDLSEKLLKSNRDLLETHKQTLLVKLEHSRKRQNITNNLYRPEKAKIYLDTLTTLPENAPDLASGLWRKAVSQAAIWKNISASAQLGCDIKTEADLKKAAARLKLLPEQNIFYKDCSRLISDPQFSEKLAQMIDQLKQTCKKYDLFELTMTTPEGVIWHIYSPYAPDASRQQLSNQPKEIRIKVKNSEVAHEELLLFKVAPKIDNDDSNTKISPEENYQFITKSFVHSIDYPKMFIRLNNAQISRNIAVKSAHYVFLHKLLADLQDVKTPEKLEDILLQNFAVLSKTEMNILVKAKLIEKMLDLLAISSSFYEEAKVELTCQIQFIAASEMEKWQQPDIMQKNVDKIKKLNELISKIYPEALKKHATLSKQLHTAALKRNLTPGGIIIKSEVNQQCKVHYFKHIPVSSELWFYVQADNPIATGWVILPGNLVSGNSTLLNNSLNPEHGTVFFVALDMKSTEKMAAEYKKHLQEDNLFLPVWPSSWPLNVR